MPRPRLHSDDRVLDAARDLVLAHGPRAVGVRAIAARSGAPSGSLYHRFSSRDDLIARAWLRAVRRFQVGYLEALADDDPVEAGAGAAGWAVRFALREPADARLLLEHSRASLLDEEPSPATAAELATVNEPVLRAVGDLARRLYRSSGVGETERVSYAVIDLPYAVIRRRLVAGTLTTRDIERVERAVRDLLRARRRPREAPHREGGRR